MGVVVVVVVLFIETCVHGLFDWARLLYMVPFGIELATSWPIFVRQVAVHRF